jgi:WD40 repeat protein
MLGEAGTAVTSLVFSPDGQRLFSAEEDGKDPSKIQIKVRNASSGEEVRSFVPPQSGRILAMALSPDGRRLALAFQRSNRLSVVDSDTGAKLLGLEESSPMHIDIAFSPDGRRIIAGPRMWDAVTGFPLLTLGKGSGTVLFSPDGGLLAAVDWGGIAIWDGRPVEGN